MKKFIFLSLATLLLYGCDAPQRTRMMEDTIGQSNANGFGQPNQQTTSGNTGGTNPVNTTAPVNTGAMPAGFTGCDLTIKYYAPTIGGLGICQSTSDETSILLKSNLTDSSVRTCLIPTYKDQAGNSAYLGQPQCLYTNEATPYVQGKLYKTRNGFAQYPLNGVMVMKETIMPAYFQCMDAYVNYVSQACPYGAKTNAACDQYARNYMLQLCNTFKSNNPYLDIRLTP